MYPFVRALVALPLAAACATAPALVGGDPADPSAKVAYQPPAAVFPTATRFRPVEPAPWRPLNDEAGRIGGASGQMRGEPPAEPVARP
ncbi:hypothetical protein EDC65_1479 [Stella humosa]|uniref:Uncharacterized protein n=1 Tax=Stella humosa TaxID=94 RepID=A0A3N1M9H6_9PROT|nr:hypothetical protein [Stella humosa]ROP99694.1 hypothetical protein EDC65_1479 [Stella humosa]BBK31080.1 hypothetical protein STHU_17140 [Stella humosa]